MTNKEKMLAGEVYSAVDGQLLRELNEVKEIIYDYNHLRPGDSEGRGGVTLPRGDSESSRRQEVFEIRIKSDVNHSCIQRAARLAYRRYPYFKSRFKTIDGSLF